MGGDFVDLTSFTTNPGFFTFFFSLWFPGVGGFSRARSFSLGVSEST